MKTAVKTFYSLQDLTPDILEQGKRKRARFHRPVGVPVKESVEYRIIQKRREIAKLNAELGIEDERPKVKKLRVILFGEVQLLDLSEREQLLATGWQFEEVEVDL